MIPLWNKIKWVLFGIMSALLFSLGFWTKAQLSQRIDEKVDEKVPEDNIGDIKDTVEKQKESIKKEISNSSPKELISKANNLVKELKKNDKYKM